MAAQVATVTPLAEKTCCRDTGVGLRKEKTKKEKEAIKGNEERERKLADTLHLGMKEGRNVGLWPTLACSLNLICHFWPEKH